MMSTECRDFRHFSRQLSRSTTLKSEFSFSCFVPHRFYLDAFAGARTRGKPRGYIPTEEPGPLRLNMTVEELHAMLERFKKLFEDSALAKYMILAGLGGIAGTVLAIIEIVRGVVELVKHYR